MNTLIHISGEDAVEFLQGQLTQDVDLLDDHACLPAAWCNPKGRVLVTLRLFRSDGGIGLEVPSNMSEAVVRRLTMYRLRAKVNVTVSENRLPGAPDACDPSDLVEDGIPLIDATNSEEFTPHMINLDRLGAISFSKGCYTGQEIVARTENLGKSKRRMMRYRAAGDGIRAGDKVSNGERNVGEVVNVAGTSLLAVTPVSMHAESLTVNGTAITPLGLPYSLT